MNLYKTTYYLITFLGIALLTLLFSCTNGISTGTKKPTLADYEIGEQLTWDWRRSINGEVRAQGEDFQEVVAYKNTLGFTYGTDTVTIASIIDRAPSKDAAIVSYDEVTVAAGTFMAYKIEYKGRISNSRGFDGKLVDTWWYAPELKNYIKHTQDDGEGLYVNELINYDIPNKQ